MALRNIVKDGDEILKKKCRPVEKFDARLAELLDDMAETMVDGNGLGLAGPQVGVMRRLFVVAENVEELEKSARGEGAEDGEETEEHWEIIEFVNPDIIETEGEVRGYEGCLSFPGRYAAIPRPERVKVRAQDRDGNTFEYEATGTLARCLCHETNHLDGVTIDDLAEYFYDPEVPHDLDTTLLGQEEEDEPAGEAGETGEVETEGREEE